jgi:benzodiazapine receptor
VEVASKSQLRMSFLRLALVCVPAVVLLGSLSGLLSNSGYENGWFRSLDLPSFMPPSWAFPVAWTTLYTFLGLALALILHARGARRRGTILALFLLQLALNYSWSPVFFSMHQIVAALAIIVAMIVLTLVLIAMLWPVRRAAALLMVPYLAWLCFATALNYQIMVDNPGASGEVAPRGSSTDIAID